MSEATLIIGCNSGAEIALATPEDVGRFVRSHGGRLAALLYMIRRHDEEDASKAAALEMAGDMAWELEQAIEFQLTGEAVYA